MQRVVTLPTKGTLIVATDVQGNLEDLVAVGRIFEERNDSEQGATLVVTGDLVHGPEISAEDWPDHLGSFYEGNSPGVVRHARDLAERYPGRVHFLLGNHEHAHVGGPVVSKFFPNEADRLESLLGASESARLRNWIRTWPFVAIAQRAQIALMHAAPHADIRSIEELEQLPLEPGSMSEPDDLAARATLLHLLWSRTTTSPRARAFLNCLHPSLRVAVYGHDVARGGYAIDAEGLLCVSTSFGCHDGDKMYLEWDLSRPVHGADELARDGLRLLYPDAQPRFRSALPRLRNEESVPPLER